IQVVNASASAPVNAQDVVVGYDAGGNRVETAGGSVQVSAAQGVQLAYDAVGNRRIATTYDAGALVTDSYAYDGDNRVVSTSRAYDWAGRLTEMDTYVGANRSGLLDATFTALNERRVNTYNNKSWLLQQDIYNGAGTLTQRTSYGSVSGEQGAGFNVIN